jgi:hypothetical protein
MLFCDEIKPPQTVTFFEKYSDSSISMPRWEQHARGSSIKTLYIVAPFHETEDKLFSGFRFENDSL